MARRPIDRLAAARWPQGRQVIWDAIRARCAEPGPWTLPDIARACGLEIHTATIRSYLQGLINAGIVEIVARPAAVGAPVLYRLASDPGAEAPRVTRAGKPVTQGLATENIWRTLKRAGAVTVAELALLAATEEVPVSPVAVKDYVKYLKRAGYVRVAKPASPRGGKEVVIFLAARDPGPLPPQIQRVKRVWDPNSERVVWPVDGEHDHG